MPSVRLLSIVHRSWQLRLSEKQYQELIESKASRTIRTEAAFLSTAGWSLDDTLHEMTSVRSDVGNLLQLRARPPPPPLKPPYHSRSKGFWQR